ncbi:unnamed protein product [Ophioblennius macclurei]
MARSEPFVLEKAALEIGWDQRYAVPVLHDENTALVEEICQREKLLAREGMALEKTSDTKRMMVEAMKGLGNELRNNEPLTKVKEIEDETENHLAAIEDRQGGVLSGRVARIKTGLKSYAGIEKNFENRILLTNQNIEMAQGKITLDQQSLEALVMKSAAQLEDTMTITKYTHKDDKRIKSLTLAIERMALEVNNKCKAFEKYLTENKCSQFAMDKTAENLQKAYQETQHQTRRWENTIKQMKERDAEMQQCALQLTHTKETHRDNIATQTESSQLYDAQRKNNKETQKKIERSKSEFVKFMQDLTEEVSNFRSLQDEVGILKGELQKAASMVRSLKSHISKKKKDIQDNNEKLKEAEAYYAALEEKLKVVTQTALSEEEKAAQMDQLLESEKQMVRELDVLLRNNNQYVFLATKHLLALKANEKDLIWQVSNSKSTLSHNQLEKQEKILRRQQMTILEQSTQIEVLNEKMALLQGYLPTDEKKIWEAKISELTQVLQEKKDTVNILHIAHKESENAMRHLKKDADKSEAQKKDLISTADQLMLCCDGKERDLKTLKLKKQELIVRYQILKTEVERLSDLLNSKEDSVLSSKKRNLELQKVIKDREDDIKMQRDMLCRQLNLSDQERQRFNNEYSEKLHKIDIMKKRFEILTMSMAVPESEQENAQAYVITKAAQESEELRQNGSALDAKIRTLELENMALENSNLQFNRHNALLRQTLNKFDESNPMYQQKVRLEEQLHSAREMLRNNEKQINEIQNDLQDKKNTLETLVQEDQDERENIKATQLLITKVKKEISYEKINRATKQCSKLIKHIHSENETKSETFEEKDIKLKELKEFIKGFYVMLEKIPNFKPVMERYFQ